jgi:hypothetical protein
MYSGYYMGIPVFLINLICVVVKTIIYFTIDDSIMVYEIPLVIACLITWVVMKILYSNPKNVAKFRPVAPVKIIPFMSVFLVSLFFLWIDHPRKLRYMVERNEYWQIVMIFGSIFYMSYLSIVLLIYKAKYRKIR